MSILLDLEKYITANDAAKIMSKTSDYVRKLCAKGEIVGANLARYGLSQKKLLKNSRLNYVGSLSLRKNILMSKQDYEISF